MGQNPDELRRDIEQIRDGLGDTLDAIGDRVSPGRVLERRKNRAVQGIQSVRDRVMGTASDATSSLGTTTGSAMDTVRDAPNAVRHQTQGSPVAAGAVAFGVGFLAAAIFPPSRSEQHAVQGLMDKAEPLKDELTAAAKDVAQNVKGAAQDAVEDVKSVAADSKQAVTESVREGVDSTTSSTRQAADTVKNEATS